MSSIFCVNYGKIRDGERKKSVVRINGTCFQMYFRTYMKWTVRTTRCMTGSTPVDSITFPRSKPYEDRGYSEVHDLYDDLVCSLLLLLRSPCCSVSSSTAAALDTVQFSRIPVLFKGSRYSPPQFWPSNFREKVCLKDICRLLSLSSF